MSKGLKIFLIILIVVVVVGLLGYFGLKKLWNLLITAQMAPDNYTTEVKTGSDIETKYLANGSFEVKSVEIEYPDDADIKIISIFYPAELESKGAKYPVVLFVNGTGVGVSRYKPVFEHLASWGFIAIGNEDPSSWKGERADATLAYLLKENENKDNVFYGKADLESIGVIGHSQGGVGVYNTINTTEHKNLYKN